VLADETSVNLRTDRFKFASPGLFGAKPPQPSKASLESESGEQRPLTSKVAGLRLRKGDLLTLEFAGGGGWGDPLKRDPERVRNDVVAGYVSVQSAESDYGVALDPADFSVDETQTAQLRRDTAGS
jgi:N-methylhydantoinase B